jgi:L-threonylcarbamoyladenylate synthase
MKKNKLDLAKKLLSGGELVIFPTETVFGIGADATNDRAVKSIFKVKKRPPNNPIICHFKDINQIEKYFDLSKFEKKLGSKFWPGPLTIILKKKKNSKISNLVSNKSDLVGCRIPSNKLANKLITLLDIPIAAPSANLSERTSVTNIMDIDPILEKKIFVLKDNQSTHGLESTVVKIDNKNKIEVLRYGSITVEDLNKFAKVKIKKKSSISPGNLKKHYSTLKPIRMNAKKILKDEGLLNFGNNRLKSNIINLNLSNKKNLNEAARNFYHYLHKLDQSKCKKIAVAEIPDKGLGKTINDRLKRAIK